MISFLDSSALVKRYISETGIHWIRSLLLGANVGDVLISKLSGAEVVAALSRRYRTGDISDDNDERVLRRFALHFHHRYVKVEVTDEIINLAMELAKRRGLRGYDAVQLASGMIIDQDLQSLGQRGLTFVSSDSDLCQAARLERLRTENPNDYADRSLS